MNPKTSSLFKKTWRKAMWMAVAGMFLSGSFSPQAAASALKRLKLDLSADGTTAQVKVPPGYGTVILQRFDAQAGWTRFASKKAVSGKVNFKLPVAAKNVRWRAIGRFEIHEVSRDKFPAKFYAGDSRFGTMKAPAGSSLNWSFFRAPGMLAMADVALPGTAVGSVAETVTPVEADIWKTDGNTVYFFNQLRGLQVLDVTNPADPRITASLRLPAVGEDLYLLPGSGDAKYLVLLTHAQDSNDNPLTRINVVKVDASGAKIVQSQDLFGNLADSRMAGNSLVIASSEWISGPTPDSGMSTITRVSQWAVSAGDAPKFLSERIIPGENPLISSGPDWLAVAVNPTDNWDASDVSVFSVNSGNLVPLTSGPIRTAGAIADKFKIQWSGNVLTTISETYQTSTDWTPTTVLENFQVWRDGVAPADAPDSGTLLGKLELANGESLYATRFAGNKAYIVTFKQVDPLWVVDLSDPANPVIAGQIEVPGWSSHLEPIGDKLLAIGWESDTVAASLFDVADPAAPKLLSRLNLGAPGSYSEASWDEQALKVLPDAGLAMIPLSSYDWTTGNLTSVVQLLGLDLTGGNLVQLGTIAHGFDARRADLIGNSVVSISQRELVTADISDRNSPKVVADVSLAWPVDRVVSAGAFMVQIENGNSYGNGRATARVSKTNSSEEILSETDLGDGRVRAAEFHDGKLFVLREISSGQSWNLMSPIYGRAPGKLALDVYDGNSLPALTLLGSCTRDCDAGLQLASEHLLWPQANHPAVVLQSRPSFWFMWGGPIAIDPIIRITDPVVALGTVSAAPLASTASVTVSTKKAAIKNTLVTGAPAVIGAGIAIDPMPIIDPLPIIDPIPFWRPQFQQVAPRLLVFDTSDPAAPKAGAAVIVGTCGAGFNGLCEAADGLVVMGCSESRFEATGRMFSDGRILQTARVVEVDASGDAVVRPAIDLPGELFAVGDLDSRGFLAYTRNSDSGDAPSYKVSACDGFEAFEITGLSGDAGAAAAAGGRRLFIATQGGVERHFLNNDGVFVDESNVAVGWKPDLLKVLGDRLIGSRWNSLFAADAAGDTVSKWRFPAWSFSLDGVDSASDGGLLVPFGEYGAEHLRP